MYRQFNIQQFYVLPTQLYLSVLCGSQNKQPLFPYTALTGWLGFITETESVYCAVRTGYLNINKFSRSLAPYTSSTAMLLLPEGQAGETSEPAKKQRCFA